MKPLIKTTLIFAMSISLFSCDRANDTGTTKVHLQLPSLNRSSSSLQKFSESLTNLSTSTDIIASPYVDTGNTFNSIVPTDDSGKYPVNCVFIAVSSDVPGEAGFGNSYCGRSAATLNKISNSTDYIYPELNFGPFQGLYYLGGSISGGYAIDIEVASGKQRRFSLIGFNAQSSADCVYDVANNTLNKNNLSRPFVAASQGSVTLSPGASMNLDLQRVPPTTSGTTPTTFYDDCHFAQAKTLNAANVAMVNTQNFPFNNVRTYTGTHTYNCEAVDIDLKYIDQNGIEYPGTADGVDFTFSTTVSSTVKYVDTYPTADICANSTTFNQYYSSITDKADLFSTFQFLPNQTKQKRWVRTLVATPYTTGTLSLNSSSSAVVTKPLNFTRYNDTTILLDNIIPEKMRTNSCYEVTTYLRNLKGELITNPASGTMSLVPDAATYNAFSFYSDSSCTNPITTSSVTGPSFSASAIKSVYWVKLTSNITVSYHVDFFVNGVQSPAILGTTKKVSSSSSGNDHDLSFARVIGKSYLQNRSSICSPVFVSLVGPEGIELVSTTTDINIKDVTGVSQIFRYIPLKVQVADSSGPNFSGYQIYNNDGCTGAPIDPIGSATTPLGTSLMIANPGSSFIKLFIKPNGDTTYASRRIVFYFAGSGTQLGYPVGGYEFELTDPTY